MSVQYVKGSSPFGALGTIAGIAGTATGQPWLTALGMGMNAYGQVRNSGSYTTPGWVNQNTWDNLGGLFSGNISSNNPDQKTRKGK